MDVEKVINSVVARFIGTKHERDVKALQPLVEAINALEPEMQKLTDAQLSAKTPALKAEVQARIEGFERDDPDYKQRLQWRAKRDAARWACAISTYSSSVARFYTKAKLPR
jgi:hypothetical protein